MLRRPITALAVAGALAALPAAATAAPAHKPPPAPAPADATLPLANPGEPAPSGGRIPQQFVGLSLEWSLVERYMGPAARPGFARLMANLSSGVLRIGGSSQDVMQFQADAPNTIENITPEDLASIRATLNAVNGERRGPDGRPAPWGTILGTALSPPDEENPWRGPANAKAFNQQGVQPSFNDRAARFVTSIGLGNEPDISYDGDINRYLADFAAYQQAGVTRPYALDVPSTSEPIAPWQSIANKSVPTRFFHDWPAILDAIGPSTKLVRSAQGAATTDHFYPVARGCTTDAYRCASIERILSDERTQNFDYVVNTHASQAAQRGLSYRLGELNTVAGRGQQGVSDTAASATWALDTMFHAACPQPPDQPGSNRDCRTGAIGVNFHNSEVRAFFFPEEGNAYYNAINYDPTPAAGQPTAAPEYYGLLLFSRFAQGTRGLRPIDVRATGAPGAAVKAWRVTTDRGTTRTFVINKGAQPATVALGGRVPRRATFETHRMTPSDPTGQGRTLDAPQVTVDGRAVRADGSWPGFAGTVTRPERGTLRLTVAPGEAVTVEPASRGGHGAD